MTISILLKKRAGVGKRKGKRGRAGKGCFLFSLLVWLGIVIVSAGAKASTPAALHVYFLNVGYGDCIFLQLPDQRWMMVDSGSQGSVPQLKRFLDQQDIHSVSVVVITHPHENHFGGLEVLGQRINPQVVYINADDRGEPGYSGLLEDFKQKNIPVKVWRRGDHLSLAQEVSLEILHPGALQESVNANVLVLLLTFKDFKLLLFSDVEEKQQEEIIALNPFLKDITVVTVPHHGRNISSIFEETFVGKTFIVSTGENPWGPLDEASLKHFVGDVFRTDQDGTIHIATNGHLTQVSYAP